MSSAAIVDFIRNSTPEKNPNDKPIFEDLEPTYQKHLVRHWLENKVNRTFETVLPLLVDPPLTRGSEPLGKVSIGGSMVTVTFLPFDLDHLLRPATLSVISKEEALSVFTIVAAGWTDERYTNAINSIAFNAWLLAGAKALSASGTSVAPNDFDPEAIYKGPDLGLLASHINFFQNTLQTVRGVGQNMLPFCREVAPGFKEGIVVSLDKEGNLSSVGEVKDNDLLIDLDVETMRTLASPIFADMLETMGVTVAEMFKTMSMADHGRLFDIHRRGHNDVVQSVFQIFYAGVKLFNHLRVGRYPQKWSPVVAELIENPRYFALLRSEVAPLVQSMQEVAEAIKAQD